jgi:hypothetical protein
VSRSVSEISRSSYTSEARRAWRSASSAATLRRVTLARAAVTLASACTTEAWNNDGSIFAMR